MGVNQENPVLRVFFVKIMLACKDSFGKKTNSATHRNNWSFNDFSCPQ